MELNQKQKDVFGYVRYKIIGNSNSCKANFFTVLAYTNTKILIGVAKNNLESRLLAEKWVMEKIKKFNPIKREYKKIDINNYTRSL